MSVCERECKQVCERGHVRVSRDRGRGSTCTCKCRSVRVCELACVSTSMSVQVCHRS